jgi:hypothetical protein
MVASSMLVMSALGASTIASASCKHKILMDFTKCGGKQDLNSYLPKYSAYYEHYSVNALNLQEICITKTNTDGLFFQAQGKANDYGVNVYAVKVTFGADSTSAHFYKVDDFGNYLDVSRKCQHLNLYRYIIVDSLSLEFFQYSCQVRFLATVDSSACKSIPSLL